MSMRDGKVCVVGAGASGIVAGKLLTEQGWDFEIFDKASEFTGNWSENGPQSKMYKSTHLISSKKNTQLSDFPMPDHYPAYPSYKLFREYLLSIVDKFKLEAKTSLNTGVTNIKKSGDSWQVQLDNGQLKEFSDVFVCNGLLRQPRLPHYPGIFNGLSMHASEYRDSIVFRDKKVLIIGAGNSGCDIAVDSGLNADETYHSTRRGYYYMPKFIDGRPTQEWLMDKASLFETSKEYWAFVKQTFKLAGFDGVDFGLPKPVHEIDEAHPIMNSQLLYHIGHGDITPKPDVKSFAGNRVLFTDETEVDVDVVIYATGYDVDLSFIEPQVLEGKTNPYKFFLNMIPYNQDSLMFMGYLNSPSGFGNLATAAGRFLMTYLNAKQANKKPWQVFKMMKENGERLDLGRERFMSTERHRYELDLWKYLQTLNFLTTKLAT